MSEHSLKNLFVLFLSWRTNCWTLSKSGYFDINVNSSVARKFNKANFCFSAVVVINSSKNTLLSVIAWPPYPQLRFAFLRILVVSWQSLSPSFSMWMECADYPTEISEAWLLDACVLSALLLPFWTYINCFRFLYFLLFGFITKLMFFLDNNHLKLKAK